MISFWWLVGGIPVVAIVGFVAGFWFGALAEKIRRVAETAEDLRQGKIIPPQGGSGAVPSMPKRRQTMFGTDASDRGKGVR